MTHALEFLKQYPHWVGWKSEPDENGKPTKRPKNPATGGNAMSNNPTTWGTFEQASAAKERYNLDGVGFVLLPSAIPIVAFDLDHCLKNGELSPVAQEIVRMVPTYTEVTPSGEGLRLFALGSLPPGQRKNTKLQIECYESGRFLTVTGNHLQGTPDSIERRDSEIVEVHRRFWGNGSKPESSQNGHTPPISLSDINLLAKARSARNGDKFTRLFDRGDTSDYGGDDSGADLALCNMLAFWTGGDSSQIDRLFRQSKLYRPKWDKRHSGDGRTYGQMTIDEALANTTEIYSPPAAQPASQPAPTATDEPQTETIFKRLSLAELIQRPTKEWLIDGLIGKSDLAMLYGDAASGKTFATVDLIFCAILGKQFADKFNPVKPLAVAYTASEGIGGLPQRFTAAANRYQVNIKQVDNLSLFLDVPQLFDPKAVTSVYAFVNDWKDSAWGPLDLLVIDTLHGATWGADENASKDAGLILQAVKYARDCLECAVLLVHHANRQGAYRGSSALHGAMDSMFQTKVVTDKVFSLECFKQKDSERFAPLYFKLTPEHYSSSAYVEWLDKEVIDLNADPAPKATQAKTDVLRLLNDKPGLNQSGIVAGLDYDRKTVLKALAELEKSGCIVSTNGPYNSRVYELSHNGQLDRTTDNSPI